MMSLFIKGKNKNVIVLFDIVILKMKNLQNEESLSDWGILFINKMKL